MRVPAATLLFLASLLFLSAYASPIQLPKLPFSKAVDSITNLPGKVWNKTRTFFSKSQESTTTAPQDSTKRPIRIVFVPKEWKKRARNETSDRESVTSLGHDTSTKAPQKSHKFVEVPKKIWKKAKYIFGFTEPTKPPPNVLLVPMRWEMLKSSGTLKSSQERIGAPCRGNSYGKGGCEPAASRADADGLSWWAVLLGVAGAVTVVAAAAWVLVTRGRIRGSPSDSVKVRSLNLPLPSPPPYASHIVCTARAPAPLPAAGAADSAPAADPPPAPAPAPTHAPLGPTLLRVSSLRQMAAAWARSKPQPRTCALAPVHLYAKPVVRRRPAVAVWSSSASEDVHIYEPPPGYVIYDYADLEIDTSTLRQAVAAEDSRKM